MILSAEPSTPRSDLPRWSIADLYPSLQDRSFVDRLETLDAEVTRLIALFDELSIRRCEPRAVTSDDGDAADRTIRAFNDATELLAENTAAIRSATAIDSRDERASALAEQAAQQGARVAPLLARLADWVHSLGVEPLAAVSVEVAEHVGPLARLDERTAHQMSETDETLYAELATTGSVAWAVLQRTVTSQLTAEVMVDGAASQRVAITAVRGLAEHPDEQVRRAAYDAEMVAWPTVAEPVAAALNAIKGEAVVVNRRRRWDDPLDASLFANNVSRPTYDAMQRAVAAALPDFRRWMRAKARLHGHSGALPWWDLVAPTPSATEPLSWDEGLAWVRDAFDSYSPDLRAVVDRALDERWIDAPPTEGKSGGAFCMQLTPGRSLVLLNWSGSLSSAQTTAHELGHAYHNVTLAGRTPLQRRLPMALAETASIFCETLAVESRLATATDDERLALLDVSLAGANQVVVDISSRLEFETQVFARRRRSSLGVSELNALMLDAQADSYGDGLDEATRHPYMWLLKPHYYSSHFYNWPYTYGLLFGLGLYASYRSDPDRFRIGYADLLSRAGMDTAEELGAGFRIDVTDDAFWHASVDMLRERIDAYVVLVESGT